MTIPDICKLISQNLTHNLRLAKTDDERRQYIISTLTAFGQQVVLPLNQLLTLHGEGSTEFDRARTSALDLATLICGGLVRNANDYRTAISSLEEVTDRCSEPQLKGKLVFYMNQLKKRWNIAEPGGLAHNPRAKRIRTEVRTKSPLTNAFYTLICLGFLLLVLVRTDLTKLVFPAMNRAQQVELLPQPKTVNLEAKTEQSPQESRPEPLARSVAALYTYTDNQGVIHMVDVLEKVPQQYRRNMKVDVSGPSVSSNTPVIINGNQVIVPVTITFRGRSITARLLLDTGATVTIISEGVATQLGVGVADVQSGKSTVADGRSVGSFNFKVDSLAVAGHSLPSADMSILPGSGGKGHDGLLGMNYLKNFRYHVNFDRSVIEWGG